jgi:hypothetical protein
MDDGGYKLTFVRSLANNPKYSWNKVVRDFLLTDDQWLWSCHNDICFVPDTLPRLLSWDKPLISALVFMRAGLPLPHIWRGYNDQKIYAMRVRDTAAWFGTHPEAMIWGPQVMKTRPEDALVEIDFTSTSCTLIHRKVLEAIREKYGEDQWFLMDNDYTGGGEDRRFFERAREVGFPAFVDRSCVVGHLAGDTPIGVMDFMVYNSVSNVLGTGERGTFHVDNINWNNGISSPLEGPPTDLTLAAMKMLEEGKIKMGDDMPDPEDCFVPLEFLPSVAGRFRSD